MSELVDDVKGIEETSHALERILVSEWETLLQDRDVKVEFGRLKTTSDKESKQYPKVRVSFMEVRPVESGEFAAVVFPFHQILLGRSHGNLPYDAAASLVGFFVRRDYSVYTNLEEYLDDQGEISCPKVREFIRLEVHCRPSINESYG